MPNTFDYAGILFAAQRSQAAYYTHENQSKAVFTSLGYTWIGMWQNASCQAVLSTKDNKTYLSISGTRASALKLEDIFLDIDLAPLYVGNGAYVTKGVDADLAIMWAWVLQNIPLGTHLTVDGHSLGGARAQLTPLFMPANLLDHIYSFESPKFAQANYFAVYMPELNDVLTCVLNGADGWAAWPWQNPELIRPPVNHLWLKPVDYEWIQPHLWPGGMEFRDHDIQLVVDRLTAIVVAQTKALAAAL